MSTSTTQQFDGATIEDALSAAVATMGDDLEILDAQKVLKRRRFGVRREERFEVIAATRGRDEDEFEHVLRRMVERVDDEESRVVDLRTPARGGVDLADSDMDWWTEAEFVVPDKPKRRGRRSKRDPGISVESTSNGEIDVRDPLTIEESEIDRDLFGDVAVEETDLMPPVSPSARDRSDLRNRAEIARETESISPVILTERGLVGAPEVPIVPTPAHAAPQPVVVFAPADRDGIVWSIDDLAAIGVPPLVLERVVLTAPSSDFEWVGALTAALADLSDAIGTDQATVELTGYGRRAALDLVAGICRGMRAGDLVIDGVRVPATPLELALGIRSCLQS